MLSERVSTSWVCLLSSELPVGSVSGRFSLLGWFLEAETSPSLFWGSEEEKSAKTETTGSRPTSTHNTVCVCVCVCVSLNDFYQLLEEIISSYSKSKLTELPRVSGKS